MGYPLIPLPESIQFGWWGANTLITAALALISLVVGVLGMVNTVLDIESRKSNSGSLLNIEEERFNLKMALVLIALAGILSILGAYVLILALLVGSIWVLWLTVKGICILFGVKPKNSIYKWYNRIG